MTRDLLITLTLSICLSIKNSQISADHNAKLIPIKVDAHDSSLASGPKRSLTRYRRFGTKVKREEHNSSSTTEAPKKNKTSGFSGGFPPVPNPDPHLDIAHSPFNPNNPNSPYNPNNPNSPYNPNSPNNPINPNSPYNPHSPNNPNSPHNPINQPNPYNPSNPPMNPMITRLPQPQPQPPADGSMCQWYGNGQCQPNANRAQLGVRSDQNDKQNGTHRLSNMTWVSTPVTGRSST